MIYLDNAATTRQKPQPVIDAVVSAMTTLGNSARGTHEGSLSASRMIYGTREKLATFFNCPRPDHVVFTANSTEALNMAICGLLDPGDHVIATDLEHNSVLRPLYRLEAERSVSLSFVPADRQGRIDYGEFGRLIRPETRAIICTHASNLTGNAVDIGRVGAIAHAHGLIFLVDASQTAGVLPIDMEAQQIDLLCFTGTSPSWVLRAPAGCVSGRGSPSGHGKWGDWRPDLQPRPAGAAAYTVGGGDPQRPRHRRLSASLDYIRAVGMETIREKEEALMRRFYEGVSAIPGVTVYGDFTAPRTAVVALNIRDYDSGEVSDALAQDYGIATRPGAHCAPRMHRALGTERQGAVRFSFGWFNTEHEIDTAIRAVKELAE